MSPLNNVLNLVNNMTMDAHSEALIPCRTVNVNVPRKTAREGRDACPKSVITTPFPFRSQTSSTSNSGSTKHKIFPRPLQGLSSSESDKSSKGSSSGMAPEANALALKSRDLDKRNNDVGINLIPQNFLTHSVDPICKINLRETSEFVQSFPKRDDESTKKWTGEIVADRFNAEVKLQEKQERCRLSDSKLLDCPGTPSRMILRMQNAGESIFPVRYMTGYLARKPFPSKWDDAEKWLQGSSCNESPSNPSAHRTETYPNSCKQLDPAIESQASSDTCRMNDSHAKELKYGQLCSWRVNDNCDEKLEAGVEKNKDGKCLGEGFPNMVDVSSTTVASSISSAEVNLSSSFGTVSSEHDKFTDKAEPAASKHRFSEPSKDELHAQSAGLESMKDVGTQVSIPSVHHRDAGTEMTPFGSRRHSRCHTPVKNSSPARHNTPASRSASLSNVGIDITELQSCDLAKLQLQGLSLGRGRLFNSFDLKSGSNWSSREEEEEEISKSLTNFDNGDCKKSIIHARAQAWEEAERSKCITRYRQEEARIEAWLNLQHAKAEAQSRKLEVKIEKIRSNLEEKLAKKIAAAQKRAEEWRAAARAEHAKQTLAASERADRMRKGRNFLCILPSSPCFACRS